MKALLIARNIYYADRCSELETIGILVLAEAMARLFVAQKTKSISKTSIEVIVDQSIDAKPDERAKTNRGIDPAV